MRRRHRLAFACALLATLALGLAPTASAHARHHHHPPQPKNIVQTAQAAGQFHTLLALLDKTGLTATLEGPGPFTVFAPTDAAFAKLPKATLDALAADPATLKKILLYHVVSGAVSSSAAAAAGSAATVEGENVTFTKTASGLDVNGSNIVTADIAASNGVIHAIDTVLTPPSLAPKNIVDTAVAAGQFTTLVELLHATGLDTVLEGAGPFTVFAPTDAAFAKLPQATLDALAADPATLKKILLYHVVSGSVSSTAAAAAGSAATVEGENVTFTKTASGLEVNGSNIVTADIAASNGVIHAIDTVLTPPSLAPAPKTIVDVAVASGQFTTLVKLLHATGLDTVLAGAGPFTVFAPTDAAFAKLPQATLDALAANPALLKQVLLYHVVSGTLSVADLLKAHREQTVEGDSVWITTHCGPRWWPGRWSRWWKHRHPGRCSAVHVNGATIVAPDVLASNGVIQAVDTVLMPPAKR